MLDNLIYSLNATLPVFIIMVIGYILKQTGWVNDNFVTIANKINYRVTLPALLFQDMVNANIKQVFELKYVLYCAIVTSICFWSIWGLSKIFVKDNKIRGAFVQASFRGSAAVLGMALILNLYKSSAIMPLMIVGAVPLYNIYSVIVLTFESSDTEGRNIKNAFIGIITNPIILSICAGILLSLLDKGFTPIIGSVISSLAKTATPLALIAMGAGFEGAKALTKIKPTIAATIIKLLLQPIIFLPFAVWLGFRGEKLIALLIMLGAPTTPSCYIMAKNMGNDGTLTSSIVVATTVLSAFSITLFLFLFKTFNLV